MWKTLALFFLLTPFGIGSFSVLFAPKSRIFSKDFVLYHNWISHSFISALSVAISPVRILSTDGLTYLLVLTPF